MPPSSLYPAPSRRLRLAPAAASPAVHPRPPLRPPAPHLLPPPHLCPPAPDPPRARVPRRAAAVPSSRIRGGVPALRRQRPLRPPIGASAASRGRATLGCGHRRLGLPRRMPRPLPPRRVRCPRSGRFRFLQAEVAEMEAHLQQLNNAIPHRTVIQAFVDKFTASAARAGKIFVQYKQVWNWFQNRRYSQRSRTTRGPLAPQGKMLPVGADEQLAGSFRAQPSASAHSGPPSGKNSLEGGQVEFEAKSARDGAWYDVAAFLSHRLFETGDPEVRVRFSGFGAEEDEWINVRKCVRQRSLPCEATECVAVLPGDLILCFQEGKEQALYFDARVLDAQRRRHDVRGCRCRFLVRYDHDHSEEIVPLRKVCRRPETDYRLQILHAAGAAASADVQTPPKDAEVESASPAEKKPPKQHKMMDVNTDEVTMVSNPYQEEPMDKPVAALLAAPAQTRNDSGSDVPMGDAEASPKVEAADEAHEDKMKGE